MLDLILVILLIVSISKPDILLAKKVKEKANDNQKKIMAKNIRKIYGILIASIETVVLNRYVDGAIEILLLIVTIILFVLFFVFAIPAIKENKRIFNELK